MVEQRQRLRGMLNYYRGLRVGEGSPRHCEAKNNTGGYTQAKSMFRAYNSSAMRTKDRDCNLQASVFIRRSSLNAANNLERPTFRFSGSYGIWLAVSM
jgi:hypothetical protein